tara:strand:- start:90 stop:3347 length:3258 start_codon:yes stop_codon:yes gene_type:complete
MSFLNSIINLFGTKSNRDYKKLAPFADKINNKFYSLEKLSNDDLRSRTLDFKNIISESVKDENEQLGKLYKKINTKEFLLNPNEKIYEEIDSLNSVVYTKVEEKLNLLKEEAFAVMKETARRFTFYKYIEVEATDFDNSLSKERDYIKIKDNKSIWDTTWKSGGVSKKWDMIHYDVQLMGGLVLHEGKIAEMQTGEGKTLVATLPIYLNALSSFGVHVVTVNDYLAKRDAEWMRPLFEFHQLSVDCIDNHSPNSIERRNAYKSDITYGTNSEFGFDYLRDNMANSKVDLVQKKLNYAIVDEVDSVLIDDARTPLIISGAVKQQGNEAFQKLKPLIEKIVKAQKDLVGSEFISLKSYLSDNNNNEAGIKLLRIYRGLPKNKSLIKFLSEDGMKTLLQKTENKFLQDQSKEMHIIDNDLFFTIDEKNNSTELTDKGIDFLSKFSDDKDFFVLPDIGLEIAKLDQLEDKKIAEEKKTKLIQDFSLKSERIHTLNQLLKAYTLFEKDIEYVVMDNKVKIVDEQTGRVMDGRRYSDGLHQAIEAKENCKIEASTQTLASITLQNFFRMYNKLSGMTGTASTESGEFWDIYKLDVIEVPTNKPILRDDKNDLVYKTNKEKYNAIVDEIIDLNKKNRPVLVGTTSVEISELISRVLKRSNIRHNVLNAKLHKQEADIVAEAGESKSVTIATNMAGRGTDIKLAEGVKESGGLAILGTERHDSRRVDRQLRGRSGRQGDPGSSQFFVSLEDNLMRLFGSDRIAKLMDRMGHKEGEVIQHSMITKSIERAQKKIEENNFGIRKRLLEYDDVMNSQREVIYKKRKNALMGEKLSLDLSNSFNEMVFSLLDNHMDSKNFSLFKNDFLKVFSLDCPINEDEFNSLELSKIQVKIYEYVFQFYMSKLQKIKFDAFPVVNKIYLDETNNYKNIIIPFFDGRSGLNVVTNLEESHNSQGNCIIKDFERSVVLSFIDRYWKEHLREMDDLRQSVQGAVYEQKDPLLIYKFESFKLFEEMLFKINSEIISFLFKSQLPSRTSNNISEAKVKSQFGKAERGEELSVKQQPNAVSSSSQNNLHGSKNPPLSRRQRRLQERGRRR